MTSLVELRNKIVRFKMETGHIPKKLFISVVDWEYLSSRFQRQYKINLNDIDRKKREFCGIPVILCLDNDILEII